jgi:hypothetical protein
MQCTFRKGLLEVPQRGASQQSLLLKVRLDLTLSLLINLAY